MKIRCVAIALVGAALNNPVCAEEANLRAAVSSAWTLPIGAIERERLVGGILLELYRDLGSQLKLNVIQVVLPRKRLDAAGLAGDYDVRCYINPKWTETPDIYTWSKALFEVSNILIGAADSADPKSIEALPHGALVSTVLGYSYPALDALFASGRLKREDTVDEEKLLLKMTAKRTPYAVTSNAAVDWYRRTTPGHNLSDWRLILSRTEVHCAIPRNGAVPAAKVIEALEQIKRSGRLDAILRNFR
jgi:polar amino acid transport system substrate-binding protein